MALRYIFGGPGTGKTTRCIEEIYQASKSYEGKLFYIVPEQYSLQAEKNLVARFPGKSSVQAQVLSFERLAYHVLSETGTKQRHMLDFMGKNMIVRKILQDVAPKLKYYQGRFISDGLVQNITESLKEFYQYGVMPGDLMAAESLSPSQRAKFEDIRLIYEEYRRFVEQDFLSSDATLDALNEHMGKSGFVQNALIWIDNFSGFTPQEYQAIRNLLHLARTVNICVGIRDGMLCYDKLQINDIYYESKYLVNKLTQMAEECRVKVHTPLLLSEPYRFKDAPELMWIVNHYDKFPPPLFPGENNRVKIMEYMDKYDEIHGVAGKITMLVRDKGIKYSEIAVLTGDMDAYAPSVHNIFSRYNIPCFVDKRIGVLSHPLTEFIRALFEIIMKNWSYESVYRLLKTNMLELDMDDVDLLENYVLAYGIKGWRWQQKEWTAGFGPKTHFDKEKIHEMKQAVLENIMAFTEGYQAATRIDPEELCAELYNYLLSRNIPERMNALAMEAAENKDMQLYREHSGIWKTIMGVLDRIQAIFGKIPMDLAEFSRILDAGFSSCDMGIIPPAQDQVVVGDIYRSRLDEIRALIVIGVNSDSFPKKAEEEGVLDDDDKKLLEKAGVELGLNSYDRSYINSHLGYSVLTKASDYLFLTYAKGDIQGKTLLPSPVINTIKGLLNCDANEKEVVITLPNAMLRDLGNALNKKQAGGPISPLEAALLDWYVEQEQYHGLLTRAGEDAYAVKPLTKTTLSGLYQNDIRTSISRLEKYVECPFAYFVRYNLQAADREYYQVRSVDLGNIFHDVLERFSRYADSHGMKWAELSFEEIRDIVDIIFEELTGDERADIFSYDVKSAYILERVKKTSLRSIWALSRHIAKGDFAPYGSEVDFGLTSPVTGIKIDINDAYSFTLTGRIDRIDILDKDGETYVKIIDYKSGNKKFDLTDIYYGMQMQLLVYLGAIIKNGDKILSLDKKPLPGGIFYFRLNDPVIDYMPEKSEKDVYDGILEAFKMSGLVLNDSRVIEGMDHTLGKNSSIIPVGKNAKGGYGSRAGALASGEDFKHIINYAEKKIGDIGNQIVSGNIQVKPYKKGLQTGCDFCTYASVCGFDGRLTKSGYRLMQKKKGFEEMK